MFGTDAPTLYNLLISIVLAYVLGALPLADRLSRRRDVDIFTTGTGLAGATNVMKNVGKVPAILVVLGDTAKGCVAVFVGQQFFGLEGAWIVAPAAAAVVGHWKSVFSGFRGGDGLVTLGGATLVAFPEYGIIGVSVAAFIALAAQKMPFSSLINIPSGYLVVIALAYRWHPEDLSAALAMSALGVAVLVYALLGHARRRRSSVASDLAAGQIETS